MPLCFAIAYPYLKLAFSALQTTVNTIDERTTKRISGKGFIATTKFLDLRDQYERDLKRLSSVIQNESDLINQNIKVQSTIVKNEEQINSLSLQIAKINNDYGEDSISRKVSSLDYLIGKWKLKLHSLDLDATIDTEIVISRDKRKRTPYFLIGNSDDETISLNIFNYVFNPYTKKVALHLSYRYQDHFQYDDTDDVHVYFGNLSWNLEFNKLVGRDDNSSSEELIELIKIL